MSCDESLFSDKDSVRVGCSNDNAMTTIGEFEQRGANDEPYATHKNSVRKKKIKDKEIIYVV